MTVLTVRWKMVHGKRVRRFATARRVRKPADGRNRSERVVYKNARPAFRWSAEDVAQASGARRDGYKIAGEQNRVVRLRLAQSSKRARAHSAFGGPLICYNGATRASGSDAFGTLATLLGDVGPPIGSRKVEPPSISLP
jgi:hypothetical protein